MLWFQRKKRPAEGLERELRADLDLEAAEQQERGLSAAEARYAAQRALGNTTLIREQVREAWVWTSVESFQQDFRHAGRQLRKNPGFAAIAILTLAVGIGANTAIFSVMDAALLRPLPYPDASSLVRVWQSEPRMGEGHLGAAPPEFAAYRERTRVFSSVAGYQPASFDLIREGEGEPEHLTGYAVTASLFPTLQVQPLLGRTFYPQEELPGAGKVAVLSYEFWRRACAEDRQVIGKMIRLNERPYQIVGVMPRGFRFPATPATPRTAGALDSLIFHEQPAQRLGQQLRYEHHCAAERRRVFIRGRQRCATSGERIPTRAAQHLFRDRSIRGDGGGVVSRF